MQKWILLSLTMFWAFVSLAQTGNKESLNECKEELFPFQDRSSRLWGYKNFMGQTKLDAVFNKAYRFDGPYAIVETNKGKAIITCEGFQAIPTDYDEFAEVCFGRLWARKADKWGFLDMQNKVLQNFEFAEIKPVKERSLYLWARKKDKWALHYKETNQFLTTFDFDAVSPISDSASLCRKGTLFSLVVHQTGKIIADSMVAPYRVSPDYFVFEKKNKKGAFYDMGKLTIKPHLDSLRFEKPLFYGLLKNQWGALKTNGETLLPFDFDSLGKFSEGHIPTVKSGKTQFFNAKGLPSWPIKFEKASSVYRGQSIVKTESGVGLWDIRTGKFSLKPEYQMLIQSSDGYSIAASAQNGKWQLFNYLGKSLCSQTLDTVCLTDSLTSVRMALKGKWFLTSLSPLPTKAIEIPTKFYKAISSVKWGYLAIKDSARWGIINKKGVPILSCDFDSVQFSNVGGSIYFISWYKGACGLVNSKGETLIAPKFEYLTLTPMRVIKAKYQGFWGLYSMEGRPLGDTKIQKMVIEPINGLHLPAMVGNNQNKWGLLDYRGQLILDYSFDSLKFCGLNVFKGYTNKAWQLFDLRGKRLGTETFLSVKEFEDGFAPAFNGSTWGFVNNQGQWLYPPKFEEVTSYKGRSALAKFKGKWGAVDRNGNWIQQPNFNGYKLLPSGVRQLF